MGALVPLVKSDPIQYKNCYLEPPNQLPLSTSLNEERTPRVSLARVGDPSSGVKTARVKPKQCPAKLWIVTIILNSHDLTNGQWLWPDQLTIRSSIGEGVKKIGIFGELRTECVDMWQCPARVGWDRDREMKVKWKWLEIEIENWKWNEKASRSRSRSEIFRELLRIFKN